MTDIEKCIIFITATIWNMFLLAGSCYLIFWKGATGWLLLPALILVGIIKISKEDK